MMMLGDRHHHSPTGYMTFRPGKSLDHAPISSARQSQQADAMRIVDRKIAFLNPEKAASLHPQCSPFSPSWTLLAQLPALQRTGWLFPQTGPPPASMRGGERRKRGLMCLCLPSHPADGQCGRQACAGHPTAVPPQHLPQGSVRKNKDRL